MGGSIGGSGGTAIDAGRDAPIVCNTILPSPVTFHMTQAPGSSFCTNNCGTTWVTVVPPDGGPALTLTNFCRTTCDICQPLVCAGAAPSGDGPPGNGTAAACAAPQPFPAMGESYSWDGFLWTTGTCGPNGYACVSRSCSTPPGKYIARMCANRRTSDAGTFCMYDPVQTCVDVPFDYPATGVVEGTLR